MLSYRKINKKYLLRMDEQIGLGCFGGFCYDIIERKLLRLVRFILWTIYLFCIIYNINMLGLISIILFIHSAFSALRSRKYFQANQEPYTLPLDVHPLRQRLLLKSQPQLFSPISLFSQILRNSSLLESSSKPRGTYSVIQL